jgi:hypothetical protein
MQPLTSGLDEKSLPLTADRLGRLSLNSYSVTSAPG